MAGGGRQRRQTATFLLSESWRDVHVAGSPGASGLPAVSGASIGLRQAAGRENETARGHATTGRLGAELGRWLEGRHT